MEKIKHKRKLTGSQLEKDYQSILKKGQQYGTFIAPEWEKEGDSFKVFTMYTDFTPVTTSYKVTYQPKTTADAELDGNSKGN